ncbi:MAG: PhoU family transcriptional regulator [Cenarchaeum sp. SB0666_bin_15]|nr:PhoU family transcriptional regulator [Cenarchaeum sp. SB0666_bin_15]
MTERYDTRKIQYTGRSSYIISLPKDWVLGLGLKQGDQIRISKSGATNLLLYPPNVQPKTAHEEAATIEIGPNDELASITRKLISLYFMGFKTIHIKPKINRLRPNQRLHIKESVRRILMGSEIVSDSSSVITVQVLINLLELTVEGAFKRMVHLAKSVSKDALLAVQENNKELAAEVTNMDDEIDRFGFYIIRQLKIAIQNDHILKEIGFKNARSCLGYRILVKCIERMGDHAVMIAQDVVEFDKKIDPEAVSILQEMNTFALSVLDDACLALFKDDYNQAEATIIKATQISEFDQRLHSITDSIRDSEIVFRSREIADNIRRIAEYSVDIAEIVLNLNIEKTIYQR